MWFLHPPKSRRRWHVFTWLAAVPALVFVALVQVAGVEVEEPPQLLTPVPQWYVVPMLQSVVTSTTYPVLSPELVEQIQVLPLDVEEHLHGWPVPWLRRASGYGTAPLYDSTGSKKQPPRWPSGTSTQYSRSWQNPDAWPWRADKRELVPFGLALNIFVAAAIVAVVMTTTEVWLRRRGGPFRFKLLDIGGVATLVAVVIAGWKFDQQVTRREAEVVEHFHTTQTRDNHVESSYVGPEWLARLCGGARHVPVLERATCLHVGAVPGDRLDVTPLIPLTHLKQVHLSGWLGDGQVVQDLRNLPYLRELVIGHDFRSPYVARVMMVLGDNPGIEKLSIQIPTLADELGRLGRFRDLRTLEINTDLLTDDEFEHLRERLASVVTTSTSDDVKPPSHLERIEAARMSRKDGVCGVSADGRSLRLLFLPFDGEHLAPLASLYARIEELTLTGRSIPSGGAELLAKMDSLSAVDLCVSEIPDEFLLELRNHARLRRVTLRAGQPSLEALLRLADIPDCQLFLSDGQLTEDQIDQLKAAFGDRLQLH